MVNNKIFQQLILEYKDFKLIGISSNTNPMWYEFSIYNKNFIFKNAGGDIIDNFVNNILKLKEEPEIANLTLDKWLERFEKKSLRYISNILFIGLTYISGYITFAFFSLHNNIYICITYDNYINEFDEPYQLIKIPKKVFEQWCEYLLKFKENLRKIN